MRPNLITGVATTRASVADAEMTTPVNAALHRRDLAPGRHYLDSGYGSARHVLDAARLFGITVVTPLPADSLARPAPAMATTGRLPKRT